MPAHKATRMATSSNPVAAHDAEQRPTEHELTASQEASCGFVAYRRVRFFVLRQTQGRFHGCVPAMSLNRPRPNTRR